MQLIQICLRAPYKLFSYELTSCVCYFTGYALHYYIHQ